MKTIKSILLYYQIPKLLHEDENIKAQHIYIFMILYDQLRQQQYYNKTNEWLSKQTKIGIRQLKSYLNDLEEWGYIEREGMGYSRKFSIGNKLINSAESEPVLKQNRAESEPGLGGKGTGDRAESELHNKNLIKNYNNKENPAHANRKPKKPTQTDLQEYAANVKGYEWVGDYLKKG